MNHHIGYVCAAAQAWLPRLITMSAGSTSAGAKSGVRSNLL
jgi:hypothetical protein